MGRFDDLVASFTTGSADPVEDFRNRNARKRVVALTAANERLKRKAQNLIDRAYNQGVKDALNGDVRLRKVRHADEFGD